MIRIKLIPLALSLLALTAHAADQPNLVVILADDQGWGDLSHHGNGNLRTPHIDRLAEAGATFENFYVSPVCSPTRGEYLTGRYHARLGIYSTSAGGERLNAEEETLADIFQKAGYATGAFGKWHSGTQAPYHPLCRGFDTYYGFTSGHWGSYFDPLLDRDGSLVMGYNYLPDDLTRHAIAFIEEKAKASQPFFAYLAMPTPHSPMQTTDEDWERFKGKELDFRNRDPDRENLDHTRAALAMVENIDQNVGRILQSLEGLGIEDSTIVAYFSDNGPNGWRWNGGMRGRKGSTDEGGVRSPLFIRWNGKIAGGRKIEQIAQAIDLRPTFQALAGIDSAPAQPLDGIDLSGALLGEEAAATERVLISAWNGKVSARNQRFRLDNEGRLYSIPDDRGQDTDVSAQYPEVTKELKDAVERYRDEFKSDPSESPRPFTVGYAGLSTTQLPARDASWSGGIERSNRYPNCSYLTNWTDEADEIFWDIDVGQAGRYRASVHYACPEASIGTELALSSGNSRIGKRVHVPHDPPAYGKEHDRSPRTESYVKYFRPMEIGVIDLAKGSQRLKLSADAIPGEQAIEFRLLTLEILP